MCTSTWGKKPLILSLSAMRLPGGKKKSWEGFFKKLKPHPEICHHLIQENFQTSSAVFLKSL